MSETIKKNLITSADLSNTIGTKGDVAFNIDNNTLVIFDGQTVGGKTVSESTHTHPVATTVSSGFMSASDKTKLDGLTGSTLPSGSSQNNPNTTVIRDGSGNFSANQITANSFIGTLNGSASSISGNLTGDVTSVGMTTTLSNVNNTTGTFGTSTQVAQVTVDSKGRVTNVQNVTITGAAPVGAAGGDLTGNFPNPVLINSGVTAGTYGNSNQVAQLIINSKGVITGAQNVTITGASPTGLAGGDLTGNFPNPSVSTVGGKTSSAISSSVDLTVAATSAATNNAIARRDANGKFLIGLTQVGDPANTVVSKSYVDGLSGSGGSAKNCAIYRINGGQQQVSINGSAFTTLNASIFNVPNNVSALYVILVGGGAGGAGGNLANPPNSSGAPGGGSGAVIMGLIPVTPGSVLSIGVGTPGVGGTVSGLSTGFGTPGGASVISGALITGISAGGGICNTDFFDSFNGFPAPSYSGQPAISYSLSDFVFIESARGGASDGNGPGGYIPGRGARTGFNASATGDNPLINRVLELFAENATIGRGGNGQQTTGQNGNPGKIWIYY